MVMPSCRFCSSTLRHSFLDLGMSPLCESYLSRDQLNQMEPFYRRDGYVCSECVLVQRAAYVTAEHTFSDFAHFPSYWDSWLAHSRLYTEKMVERFHLGPRHHVVELASNDGYLLQHFVARGIPALGVE